VSEDSLQESLNDQEVLKNIIKNTIIGICEKGIKGYPNICAYGTRSKLDVENIVEKVLAYMISETMPMALDSAINMVDCELGGGLGD
jgi:hypothetical protein